MSQRNSALAEAGPSLRARTALVVGADNHLGSEAGRRIALQGFRVIGLGADASRLRRLAHDVEDTGGSFAGFAGEPGDAELTHRALDAAFEQDDDLHAVVNVAHEEPPGASREFDSALASFYRWRLGAGRSRVRLSRWIDCVTEPVTAADEHAARLDSALAYTRLYLQDRALFAQTHLIAGEIVGLLTAPGPARSTVKVSLSNGEVIAERRSLDGAGMGQFRSLGPVAGAIVFETDGGLGVLAERHFRRGELIVSTTGKVIEHQTEHSIQIGWDRHLEVDAPVRYLNHSCEPNAGVKTNRSGIPDLVAFRDIHAGEEITLDYAMTEFMHYPRANPALDFSLACHCGLPRCRGRLGYYSELPDDIKQDYAGFVADYLTFPQPEAK